MDGPAYERVANQLRAGILAGDITGPLPALPGLAKRYHVTVDVARRAVDVLRGEGLLVTRQGSGTYVRRFQRIERVSPDRLAATRWGTGETIQDADTHDRPRVAHIVVGEVPAPADVAAALELSAGEPVLSRQRRYTVEDRPVNLSTTYLPLDIAGGTRIAYTDVGPGGTYARLAELGHAPARFTERVTARAPRPDEVDGLDMASSVGAVVVEILQYAYTEAGRCVAVTRMVLDAAAYELVYHFTA